MQTNRSELRKLCMTILYQIDVYQKNSIDYKIEDIIHEVSPVDNEFVKDIVYGVMTYKNDIDEKANKYLKDWTIDRLGNTDRAILRMGIFELIYMETPSVVVINEAVELAKMYSDEAVKKMINGVLDNIYKNGEANG